MTSSGTVSGGNAGVPSDAATAPAIRARSALFPGENITSERSSPYWIPCSVWTVCVSPTPAMTRGLGSRSGPAIARRARTVSAWPCSSSSASPTAVSSGQSSGNRTRMTEPSTAHDCGARLSSVSDHPRSRRSVSRSSSRYVGSDCRAISRTSIDGGAVTGIAMVPSSCSRIFRVGS